MHSTSALNPEKIIGSKVKLIQPYRFQNFDNKKCALYASATLLGHRNDLLALLLALQGLSVIPLVSKLSFIPYIKLKQSGI